MANPGITSFGAYIPRRRLQRSTIVKANAWANSALVAHGKGERAMCNWDEDSITMAVEAARDALEGFDRDDIAAVHMASTTMPFSDRQNAGICAEALNLREDISTLDVSSSMRAGTTGLINALTTVKAGVAPSMLFLAGEHRRSQTGTPQELLFGDAASALVLGTDNAIAEFLGSHTISIDFVDHYRGEHNEFDYDWEERWIRDEGYMKIVPNAVQGAFEKLGLSGSDIDYFVLPCVLRRVPESLVKSLAINPEALVDNLQAVCGDSGANHAVLMLAQVLEKAEPGQKIMVVGFGQGCDVLVFEVTDNIKQLSPRRAVSGSLARRAAEENYDKFLSFNNLVAKDFGKRAEADKQTALTTLYRNRKMITGFVGGKCSKCGTVQFPKSHYCVNPNCGEANSQEDFPMADVGGKVNTWTADSLTFSPDPPTYFGMVQFESGGRLMVDFTDVDKDTFDIESKVRMQFRVKDFDPDRGFRRYFWKAVQIDS
jgi:3-hydroxy-3-methylglutaryl CoA synthase